MLRCASGCMLENPSIRAVLAVGFREGAYGSDNPYGAENQQERLVTLGWVLGFVDGEGCFSVGFLASLAGDACTATEPTGKWLTSSPSRRARPASDASRRYGVSSAWVP